MKPSWPPLGLFVLALSLCPTVAAAQRSPRIMNQIARNHYEAGNAYYQVSRYEDAAREFQRAYEISRQPELLFNIGRALEAAGNIQGALDAYQRFDEAGAPGFDREVLRARMENLRTRLSTTPTTPPPTPPESSQTTPSTPTPESSQNAAPAPPPSHAPSPPSSMATTVSPPAQPHRTRVEYRHSTLNAIGPFATMGLGVATGVVGIVLGVLSGQHPLVDQANMGMRPWDSEVDQQYRSAVGQNTAAWILGSAGITLVGGGALWFALRGPGERHERIEAFITPSGAFVGIGGRL